MSCRCDFSTLLARCFEGSLHVATDSRKVQTGDLFCAVPGASEDGARYIEDALAKGASALLLAQKSAAKEYPVPVCVVEDVRKSLALLAAAQFHTDTTPLTILGITGTNGKTTCTYLLEHLFESLGHSCGVLGTVSYRFKGYNEPAPLTTPDPLSLHAMLSQMQKAGVEYCVMEVSSHALDQERVSAIPFSGAALTNLTQDHLDYHKDMDTYFAAKAKLFLELPKKDKAMAINIDDPYGQKLLQLCPSALSYGTKNASGRHLLGTITRQDTSGVSLTMHYEGKTWQLHSPLIGAYNCANLLTVQALGLALGLEPKDFAALESFQGVSGRLERILGTEKHIFVDYAHTPDALENVLTALRKAGFERIICVFGCGGNRDRTKRPKMGRAVARLADVCVLTSDNPRFEEPMEIINDVLPGLEGAREVVVEQDRRKATEQALALLKGPKDCLLIAGKGHETYQIIKGVRNHYSDQEVVREILQCS